MRATQATAAAIIFVYSTMNEFCAICCRRDDSYQQIILVRNPKTLIRFRLFWGLRWPQFTCCCATSRKQQNSLPLSAGARLQTPHPGCHCGGGPFFRVGGGGVYAVSEDVGILHGLGLEFFNHFNIGHIWSYTVIYYNILL